MFSSVPAHVTGRAQANEQRYSKLKEKYSELVQNHADLLRKVGSPNAPQHPPSQLCRLILGAADLIL